MSVHVRPLDRNEAVEEGASGAEGAQEEAGETGGGDQAGEGDEVAQDVDGRIGQRDPSIDEAQREDAAGAGEVVEDPPVRAAPDPGQPTRAEREQHALTHLPFRPWCADCVAGKAADHPHRRHSREEIGALVKVSVDYGFITAPGEEGSRTLLVARVDRTGAVMARCVAGKGRQDPKAASWLVEQLRRLGLGRCVLQADGEPAQRAFVREVVEEACRSSDLGVAVAHTPAHDHRANGAVEKAVRDIKDHVRVMHTALVRRVGPVPIARPIFEWMVIWAGEVLTGASVGRDGMTPYRRMRGRNWEPRLAEFGEQVMARRPRALDQEALAPRWDSATYLGTRWGSAEHLVALEDGTVVRVRAIRRVPEAGRWSGERVAKISGVPDEPQRHGCPEAVPPAAEVEVIPHDDPPLVRSTRDFRIGVEDLAAHGYTRHCTKCDAIRTGRRVGTGHSSACRARFRDIFVQHDDGRVERAEMRRGAGIGGAEVAGGAAHDADMFGADPEADAAEAAAREAPPSPPDAASDMESVEDFVPLPAEEGGEMDPEELLPPAMTLRPRARPRWADLEDSSDADEPGIDVLNNRCDIELKGDVVDAVIRGVSQDFDEHEQIRRLCSVTGIDRETWCFDAIIDASTNEAWDFSRPEHRRKCWAAIKTGNPWVVLGRHAENLAKSAAQTKVSEAFLNGVYAWQADRGRYFVHECAMAKGESGRRIRSNAQQIANELSPSGTLTWGLDSAPGKLALARGLQAQREGDAQRGARKAPVGQAIAEAIKGDLPIMPVQTEPKVARDEYTGEILDPGLVHKGKMEELDYFVSKQVWRVVPRKRAEGHKIVGTRWVCCNKGDAERPEIRCRLVAQEVNMYKTDDFFAATPPVETLRIILSMAAEDPKLQVTLVDISRAYFNAYIRRKVYVELPPEAKKGQDVVGELVKCMYGTRDAAQGWEAAYCRALEDLGFTRGKASPCVFQHRDRRICIVVHGDDFFAVARSDDLAWFERSLLGKFEGKVKGRLTSPGDELRILNRIARRTESGYEWEADQRHAELLVASAGLQADSRPLSCPGRKLTGRELEAEPEALDSVAATDYRARAARANFLASDRPDIMFTVKELCRNMSAPTTQDREALKRLSRYLLGRPRLVVHFGWQDAPKELTIFTDSDWAGCARTRRSTSGGALMRGAHVLKTWSHTQATVALSSAEAELIAIVKGASEGLAAKHLAEDFGQVCGTKLQVCTDSSGALGICKRTGVGKVRHLDTRLLWVQDLVRTGAMQVVKVGGQTNPADLMTKYQSGGVISEHLLRIGCFERDGRAQAAPQCS